MCVPVPVDKANGNISPKGKVTGGFPAQTLGVVNQMMTPFRRAAQGETLVEQRQRFSDPKSMSALLTTPQNQQQQRRPY